uniref:Uncharacterized protein n=1 Tax=Biomphalaria glabrata TaxID=6526 RepID=A0A2C9M2P6_BIOGL
MWKSVFLGLWLIIVFAQRVRSKTCDSSSDSYTELECSDDCCGDENVIYCCSSTSTTAIVIGTLVPSVIGGMFFIIGICYYKKLYCFRNRIVHPERASSTSTIGTQVRPITPTGNVDCGSYCCTSPSGYTYCEYGCCASWYDYYERCCSYNETIASPSTMYGYSNLNNGTGYNSNSKERTNITFWIVPIVVCVTVSIVAMVTKCGRSKSTKKIMPTTVATAVKDPIETFTIKQIY